MKNIILLMAFLCLGLWIGCAPNCPNDAELSKMSTFEKWACLRKGMSKSRVFKILGTPQSSRVSKTNNTVYTFNCFLCTTTFDTLNELKAWHGPSK